MKIVVLVKQVPDTWGERHLDVTTGVMDRDSSARVIDEVGERAVEAALAYKDGAQAEVVLLTMGPRDAVDALRRGLALGADSAVHVLDQGLAGADLARTAQVLARALAHIGFDLVVAGNESTDGRGGVIPAMVAEHLGVPHATQLSSVEISPGSVRGDRVTEDGTATVVAPLPAVVSLTELAPEPRFPSFRGIMRAKKKPLSILTLDDLDLAAPAAASVVVDARRRPARSAGRKVVDDGTAASQVANYLADANLI